MSEGELAKVVRRRRFAGLRPGRLNSRQVLVALGLFVFVEHFRSIGVKASLSGVTRVLALHKQTSSLTGRLWFFEAISTDCDALWADFDEMLLVIMALY